MDLKRNAELAKSIRDSILADLQERSGLNNEWEQFDNEIKDEIRYQWFRLILGKLKSFNNI